MGGDRELVMFAGLLSGTLIFALQSLLGAVLGLCLWFVVLLLARVMAKADPKLRSVYLRHRLYKKYYPARSTPFRNNTTSQGNLYK